MPGVDEMWNAFAAATGVDAPYTAWAFGDERNPKQMNELGLLVRDGPKRATAGLVAEYESSGDPLPVVGEYSVILDGAGEALCIIRTTEVQLKPLGEVDAAFAWDEGEGDRTLEWWLEAHIGFFEGMGFKVDMQSELVLERFDLVWPLGEPDD